MLVLSRKVGEKVVLGGNVTVIVTRVAGNRVTLGIEAPNHVRVVRGELPPQAPEHALQTHSRMEGDYHLVNEVATASVPRLAK